MNTSLLIPDDPNRALEELIAIEHAMQSAEDMLAWIRIRHNLLTECLERMTRPDASQDVQGKDSKTSELTAALSVVPHRRYMSPGYIYRGATHNHHQAIDIYKALLQRLLEEHPERNNTIQHAMDGIGRIRPYLTHDRWRLFPGRDHAWAEKHSVCLGNGWYLDTNLCNDMKRRLLRVAVKAVDLKWGEDVVVWFDGRFV